MTTLLMDAGYRMSQNMELQYQAEGGLIEE